MAELIIKSILLGLVAGLRPILIPVLVAILANRTHARRRGFALVSAAAGAMLTLCLAARLISDSLSAFEFGRDATNLAILAAGLGLLLALLGVVLVILKPKIPFPERFAQAGEGTEEAPRLGPIAAFGFFKTVFNSRILLVTLAMAANLGTLSPGSAAAPAALTLFFICSMSFLGLIMAYFLLRPEPARIRLDRLSQWSLVHGAQLVGAMALLLGAGLLLNGLSALR